MDTIKNVKHCPHNGLKGHIVPANMMTTIYTVSGQKRRICIECKEKLKRIKAEKKKPA